MKTDKELTEKTINIINKGGRIVLKKDKWYLSGWSNVAAGPDYAAWGLKSAALEFFNLKWARTIAPLYGAKVVIVYPKIRKNYDLD